MAPGTYLLSNWSGRPGTGRYGQLTRGEKKQLYYCTPSDDEKNFKDIKHNI